jgi:hypothetical protein
MFIKSRAFDYRCTGFSQSIDGSLVSGMLLQAMPGRGETFQEAYECHWTNIFANVLCSKKRAQMSPYALRQ